MCFIKIASPYYAAAIVQFKFKSFLNDQMRTKETDNRFKLKIYIENELNDAINYHSVEIKWPVKYLVRVAVIFRNQLNFIIISRSPPL